jgi:hypothetical protein
MWLGEISYTDVYKKTKIRVELSPPFFYEKPQNRHDLCYNIAKVFLGDDPWR